MSVRNILDGTIPVGGSGGLTPESDIYVRSVVTEEAVVTKGLLQGDEVSAMQIRAARTQTAELTVQNGDDETYKTVIQCNSITTPSIATPSLTLGGQQMHRETKC